jgi:hypothetical protein
LGRVFEVFLQGNVFLLEFSRLFQEFGDGEFKSFWVSNFGLLEEFHPQSIVLFLVLSQSCRQSLGQELSPFISQNLLARFAYL